MGPAAAPAGPSLPSKINLGRKPGKAFTLSHSHYTWRSLPDIEISFIHHLSRTISALIMSHDRQQLLRLQFALDSFGKAAPEELLRDRTRFVEALL
jgi:hypothetical protein